MADMWFFFDVVFILLSLTFYDNHNSKSIMIAICHDEALKLECHRDIKLMSFFFLFFFTHSDSTQSGYKRIIQLKTLHKVTMVES